MNLMMSFEYRHVFIVLEVSESFVGRASIRFERMGSSSLSRFSRFRRPKSRPSPAFRTFIIPSSGNAHLSKEILVLTLYQLRILAEPKWEINYRGNRRFKMSLQLPEEHAGITYVVLRNFTLALRSDLRIRGSP